MNSERMQEKTDFQLNLQLDPLFIYLQKPFPQLYGREFGPVITSYVGRRSSHQHQICEDADREDNSFS